MHKSFVFPLKCVSPQVPLSYPKIIETDIGAYISEGEDTDIKKLYNAFDEIDIIPSLVRLVENIKKTEEKMFRYSKKNLDLIANWIGKWGHLKAKVDSSVSEDFYGEKISDFMDEAEKFYDLWSLYRAVANRDLKLLKETVDIYEDPELKFPFTHSFAFFIGKPYQDFSVGKFDPDNELKSYQFESMKFLTNVIEDHINHSENKLFSSRMKQESYESQDRFSFEPGLGYSSLLDALYMQFFILLTENTKKICPICKTPFTPGRLDQEYCPSLIPGKKSSCYLTAKSRRQRERKKTSLLLG
jgi:hypothetical protein